MSDIVVTVGEADGASISVQTDDAIGVQSGDGVIYQSDVTKSYVDAQDAKKQDIITDLSTIRSNASDVPQAKADIVSLKSDFASVTTQITPVNILDPDARTAGWVEKNGTAAGSTSTTMSWQTINVEAGDVLRSYKWTGSAYAKQAMRFVCAYVGGTPDASLGAENVNTYTVPDGVTKVVVSLVNTAKLITKNTDTAPTEQTDYFDPYLVVTGLDEKVSQTQLNEALATLPKDVQVSGTSIVGDDGKANFNVSNGSYGILYHSTQGLMINQASITNIDRRDSNVHPITPYRINYAVKAALTDSNRIGTNNDGLTSVEKDTACDVLGAERKLTDGWVLKGTMTDTNGISVDLTGCTELAIFGVAVVTANTSIMSNVGRLSYNCLKTNAKAVLLIYEDSLWGFCCTHAKSANSTTPVAMVDNSAGDSKVDGSKLADINSIYFSDPTNVTSCNIKIYAR